VWRLRLEWNRLPKHVLHISRYTLLDIHSSTVYLRFDFRRDGLYFQCVRVRFSTTSCFYGSMTRPPLWTWRTRVLPLLIDLVCMQFEHVLLTFSSDRQRGVNPADSGPQYGYLFPQNMNCTSPTLLEICTVLYTGNPTGLRYGTFKYPVLVFMYHIV
jgi:hypothetical protein